MPQVDPDLEPDVPDAVRDTVSSLGGIYVPDNLPRPVREIYERAGQGRCMTCGIRVGEEAVVSVNALGAIHLFCGHVCNTDMMVKGYLEEQYDDISQRIEFRGQRG